MTAPVDNIDGNSAPGQMRRKELLEISAASHHGMAAEEHASPLALWQKAPYRESDSVFGGCEH
jgi:hypothetical protein